MSLRIAIKTMSILTFILINGCIEDVQLNLKDEEPEIVLNCILNTGQDTVTAWLSKSQLISENKPFVAIKDAEISLREDGVTIGEFIWQDSSAYILPIKPEPGKKYKIEAKVGGKTVWAETNIPDPVFATIQIAKYNFVGKNYMVSLTDDPNTTNYYWISAYGREGREEDQQYNIAFAIFSNFLYADDFNQRVSEYGGYNFEYEYYLRFTDKEIQNKPVDVVFVPAGINLPHQVFLLSTDVHLDKYMKSSILLEQMDIFVTESPNTYSPFPVYSNIYGGTGIFGSMNSISKTFSKK